MESARAHCPRNHFPCRVTQQQFGPRVQALLSRQIRHLFARGRQALRAIAPTQSAMGSRPKQRTTAQNAPHCSAPVDGRSYFHRLRHHAPLRSNVADIAWSCCAPESPLCGQYAHIKCNLQTSFLARVACQDTIAKIAQWGTFHPEGALQSALVLKVAT